jgi:hypothetical protein
VYVDFIKLAVLTKRKKIIEILLFFNSYSGKIISIEEINYKNDDLFSFPDESHRRAVVYVGWIHRVLNVILSRVLLAEVLYR